MRAKTIAKHEAHGHIVKVSRTPKHVDLTLDGHCLVITGADHEPLLTSIARNLVFALQAPERRKRLPRIPR